MSECLNKATALLFDRISLEDVKRAPDIWTPIETIRENYINWKITPAQANALVAVALSRIR